MALRAVPDHPKFAELKAILNQPKGSTLGWLEAMWHFAGRFTPQGNIGKYSDVAIEAWVEWNGKPGELIAALVESKWIDVDSVHRLLVHDWAQHSDKATKNSLMRSKLTFCTPGVRTEIHGVRTEIHGVRTEVPESGTAYGLPVPVPVPEPVPEPVKKQKPSPEATSLKSDLWISIWNNNRGSLPTVRKSTRDIEKTIFERCKEYSEDEFADAVIACSKLPFTSGENERGWKATLPWLLRGKTGKNDGATIGQVLNGKYGEYRAPPKLREATPEELEAMWARDLFPNGSKPE